MIMPTPMGVIPVPMIRLPRNRTSYLYMIKLDTGQVIQAMSESQFNVNECVRLWHASDLTTISGNANYVIGGLELASGCSGS
jgi:hypothetical protein